MDKDMFYRKDDSEKVDLQLNSLKNKFEGPQPSFDLHLSQSGVETDINDINLSIDEEIQRPKLVRRYLGFVSRSLKPHETRYGITKLEGLSILFALSKFQHFLTGNKFKLFTDHKALVNLFKMRNKLFTNTMCTWLKQILSFDFELVHLPGIENFLLDKLSCLYENTVKSRREELKEEVKDFHYMRKINYKDLPEDEQDAFLEELHLETGHGGINLMVNTCHYDREIHFEGLTKKCGSIVRNCKVYSKFNLV
jgi:hypothetical protein